MKSIEEIQKMTLEDLEKVSLDAGISMSGNPAARALYAARKKSSEKRVYISAGIAAAVALVVGIGSLSLRPARLTDTYSDPYLAYAEIEKAFGKIGGTVSSSRDLVEESGERIDIRIESIFESKR